MISSCAEGISRTCAVCAHTAALEEELCGGYRTRIHSLACVLSSERIGVWVQYIILRSLLLVSKEREVVPNTTRRPSAYLQMVRDGVRVGTSLGGPHASLFSLECYNISLQIKLPFAHRRFPILESIIIIPYGDSESYGTTVLQPVLVFCC